MQEEEAAQGADFIDHAPVVATVVRAEESVQQQEEEAASAVVNSDAAASPSPSMLSAGSGVTDAPSSSTAMCEQQGPTSGEAVASSSEAASEATVGTPRVSLDSAALTDAPTSPSAIGGTDSSLGSPLMMDGTPKAIKVADAADETARLREVRACSWF